MDIVKQTRTPDNGWTQHYDVVREMGDCLVSIGEYKRAKDCYDKAAALAPDEAGPYIGAGVIALSEGRLDDADLSFRVARRLDPRCSRAYCGLAMVQQQRDLPAQAFELYLRCLELDTDNLTAILGLFQTSCKMGSFSKVIQYLEIYLDSHPADSSVMFCLAALYHKDGKSPQARQLLLDILAIEPENKDAANLLEEVEHLLSQNNPAEVSSGNAPAGNDKHEIIHEWKGNT